MVGDVDATYEEFMAEPLLPRLLWTLAGEAAARAGTTLDAESFAALLRKVADEQMLPGWIIYNGPLTSEAG